MTATTMMVPATTLSGGDLSDYIRRVRRIPRLSAEEEAELLRRYADGDAQAGHQLVLGHLYLVLRMAQRYRFLGEGLLDAVQEGNIGLLEALKRYEPGRNVPFRAYARYWVRAMLLRHLTERHPTVRYATTRDGRTVFFNSTRVRRELQAQGLDATDRAVAEELGVSEQALQAIEASMKPVSLDAPMGERDPLVHSLPTAQPTPEALVARVTLIDLVRTCAAVYADTLSERDRTIWEERLMCEDPASLSELGERFGVSKERVRQLEKRIKEGFKELLMTEINPDLDFEFILTGEA